MRQATYNEVGGLPYNDPFTDGSLSLFFAPPENEFMGIARLEALHNSTDKKHPTGAVIVSDDEIIAQLPNMAGYKTRLMIWVHQHGFCLRRILKVKSGERYDLCWGCATPENHAESRVSSRVLELHPNGLKEGDLYLWGHYWCCKDCCNAMIRAGIKRVILVEGAREMFGR